MIFYNGKEINLQGAQELPFALWACILASIDAGNIPQGINWLWIRPHYVEEATWTFPTRTGCSLLFVCGRHIGVLHHHAIDERLQCQCR
jgi:hypothetical protein